MMHGYMAFDKNDNLLVPFRTWRNTITAQSSAILTEKSKMKGVYHVRRIKTKSV